MLCVIPYIPNVWLSITITYTTIISGVSICACYHQYLAMHDTCIWTMISDLTLYFQCLTHIPVVHDCNIPHVRVAYPIYDYLIPAISM